MEMFTSFDLSVCRLLLEYPLFNYRTSAENGYLLPVLFIGGGENFEILRNKILSNGQLLNTRLEATFVTEDRSASIEKLRESAPDLERFMEIQGEPNKVEMACGSLCFKQHPAIAQTLPTILSQYTHKYVLISLDTDSDASDTIVPTPGQMIAWVKGDTIQICGTDQVFTPNRDDAAMADILDIAYRFHYAYAKGLDPYITNREIREGFDDKYNYPANIECALHVRSKLVSAGIDPGTLKNNALKSSAAEAFAKMLAEDARNKGNLLERLAWLEHRRWCVSKALAGRCCDSDTVNAIYGDDGSTTHSTDSSKKWHIALMPYGKKDGELCRHLTEQDWTVENPETIEDLDELDKQTLRVHRRCAAIARDKLECCLEHIPKLKGATPEALHNHIDQMKKALEQMQQGNRDAVIAYRHHRRKLETQLDAAPSTGIDPEKVEEVKEILKALENDVGAPIEYLTRKDYKKPNLVQVGSIPFALCGWKSTVVVKLMADSIPENVAAAWQLEPGEIIFVDTAETLEELKQLRRKAWQIDRFLSKNCNQTHSSYHVFVPSNVKYTPNFSFDDTTATPFLLQDLKSHDPTFFGNVDWDLHHSSSLEVDELRPYFIDLMHDLNATSIDVTGGKPTLLSLADGYAHNNPAGAFFIRDNRVRNFYGARGMEQQALDKGLSVEQLFDYTEASLIKRDDDEITAAFFEKYEALWDVAHRHSEYWYNFYLCFSRSYKEKAGSPHPDEYLRVPEEKILEHSGKKYRVGKESRVLKDEFDAIIHDLVDGGLLTYDQKGKFYQAACEEVIACLRNPGKVLEYYIYCTVKNSADFHDESMSWMFRHNDQPGAAMNELDVICNSHSGNTFFISAKNVTADSLDKNNFLNYICYEVGWLADRFGGTSPKTILAAPNVHQFEQGKRSNLVRKAMNRGIYLLGDRCFEPGNLEKVLTNIDLDKEDWCEFLLGETEPACV
ncbi:MAG: hypothetical protein IJZ39_11385 [Oscillospiraceae bacterium]|nr:hypothetical protein [Oscillospiraceae bacterium]